MCDISVLCCSSVIAVSPSVLYFNNQTTSLTQNVTISVIDDNILEGNENITIMLVVNEHSGIMFGQINAILDVVVLDDDRSEWAEISWGGRGCWACLHQLWRLPRSYLFTFYSYH